MHSYTPPLIRLILISLFLSAGLFGQQKKDSLWKIWDNKSKSDSIRIKAYKKYIDDYYLFKNSDSSLYHINKLLDFSRARKDKKTEAYVLNSLGIYYRGKLQYEQSIEYINKSILINKSQNDLNGLGRDYNTLGITYFNCEQFDKAIECYYKALKYFELTKNEADKIAAYSNLGMIYGVLKDTSNAVNSFKKAFNETRKTTNYKRQIIAAHNLGLYEIVFPEKRDSAEQYLLFYLEKSRNLGYKNLEANLLGVLADLYLFKVDYKSSLAFLNKILPIASEINDSSGIANYYYQLGRTNYIMHQRDQIFEPLKKSLGIYSRLKNWNKVRRTALFLSDLSVEYGKPENALYYYKIYIQAKDSLHGTETEKALFREQTKYEYEKKTLEDSAKTEILLSKFREEATIQSYRMQKWIIVSVSITIIMLALSLFYIKNIRQKKVIAEQKADIIKQKLLVSQINPHFIFNSLNAIQSYIFKEESLVAGNYLSQFADLMRMILNFSREDTITVSSEIHFLKTYLDLQKLRFADSFNYTIELSSNIEPDELLIPTLLGQPFVENAVEHGMKSIENPTGLIHIKFYIENNFLIYEIDDNGSGIKQSLPDDAESDKKHKSLATIITKERLKSYSESTSAYSLTITNKKDKAPDTSGVNVKIKIPCHYN
ncbi:MAG: histidine kinase [Bacteroidota bacterium]